MTNKELVEKILEQVGGRENVTSIMNCMTRLRVKVKDDRAINEEGLKAVSGVLGIVHSRDKYVEVVVGPGKSSKCGEICRKMGIPTADAPSVKTSTADVLDAPTKKDAPATGSPPAVSPTAKTSTADVLDTPTKDVQATDAPTVDSSTADAPPADESAADAPAAETSTADVLDTPTKDAQATDAQTVDSSTADAPSAEEAAATPLTKDADWKENKEAVKSIQKDNTVRHALKVFGEIFVPLIPGVIASGLCAGFNTLIQQLVPGWASDRVFSILCPLLGLVNTSFLTYLTAWTGYRAAERFGGTPILGGMFGMITVLDGIDSIAQAIGWWNESSPLVSTLKSGRGGILAVVFGVMILVRVEKWIRKHMPDALDVVFTPVLTLLVCLIPYIFIIMPLFGLISSGLCFVIQGVCMSPHLWVRALTGYAAALLFLPLVAMGMHHGLVALYSVQLQELGYITLYPALCMAGAGQVGAALAILQKSKKENDTSMTQIIEGALPAGILGVGEPLIYGVTLPLGKPFLTAGLGAGFGGAFVMAMQVAATTWGPSGLLGIFTMTAGPNAGVISVVYYLIGLAISCVMGFVITKMLMKDGAD